MKHNESALKIVALTAAIGFLAHGSAQGQPSLVGAVSRKYHHGLHPFDVNIPLGGSAAVEGRLNPEANADLLLVLTFSEPVTATDGTLDDTEIWITEGRLTAVAMDGVQMSMSIAVPADEFTPCWPTCVAVNLSELVDAATGTQALAEPAAFSLIVLDGDVNGDGVVDADDAEIRETVYSYQEGRIWKVYEADNDGPFELGSPAGWMVTTFTYDDYARVTERTITHTTKPGAHTWLYEYDRQDRLTKVTYPDGMFKKTTRDGRGQIVAEEIGHDDDTVVWTR